jgi:serine phosphatase RsbU (regulator of sigma subunit)
VPGQQTDVVRRERFVSPSESTRLNELPTPAETQALSLLLCPASVWSVRQASKIGATATMLGVLPPDAFSSDPWQEPFSADDRVVMYTDGLSETLGRGGDLFGSERVAQAVASGESPERVAASAAQFHVGAARDDLLVVEVRGA